MAIVTDIDDDLPVSMPDPVAIDPGYEGVTVDTARHHIDSMIVHIEGSSWTVTYYSQMLGNDSQTQPLQLDLDPAYQQYTAIYDMELKVTTPLSSTMSDETGGMTTTGDAIVYPHVIPNQGDMFIADTGDGKQSLFVVTNVERKTILKETCHEITYQVVSFLDDTYEQNLQAKTIREVYFKKDFLLQGLNPFLMKSQAKQVESIYESKKRLLGRYVKEFLHSEYKTLIVPNENVNVVTYDHFLAKAVSSAFGVDDHPLVREVRTMNCDGDDRMNSYTFWDCLLDLDDSLLSLIVKRMDIIPTHRFQAAPIYRGIAYSGIRDMYYPNKENALESLTAPSEPPMIHPVHHGDGYILSPAFYLDEDGKSLLEIEVLKAIRGHAMSHDNLLTLAGNSSTWSSEERFFYMPVLLILLKVAQRRL